MKIPKFYVRIANLFGWKARQQWNLPNVEHYIYYIGKEIEIEEIKETNKGTIFGEGDCKNDLNTIRSRQANVQEIIIQDSSFRGNEVAFEKEIKLWKVTGAQRGVKKWETEKRSRKEIMIKSQANYRGDNRTTEVRENIKPGKRGSERLYRKVERTRICK